MNTNNGKEAKYSSNNEEAKHGGNSREKQEPASSRVKLHECKDKMKNCEAIRRISKAKTSLPPLPRSIKSHVREGRTADNVFHKDNNQRLHQFCKHVSDVKQDKKLPDIVHRNKNDVWQKNAELEAITTELLNDIDSMSSEDLNEALRRIKDNPVQPFTFLADIILDDAKAEDNVPVQTSKSTEIDMKLLSLMRRIELNKTLLERTKQRVQDVKFLTERPKTLPAADSLFDEKISLQMKGSRNIAPDQIAAEVNSNRSDVRPRIDQLRQTMNLTIDMLDYVKKISEGDMQLEDLPQNVLNYMKVNDIKSTRCSEY